MSETYASFENEKYRLEIHLDDSPRNPREDLENHLTRLVCFHRRYDLGDREFHTIEEWEAWEAEHKGDIVVIEQLSMTDHGGLDIYLGRPRDPWDSGQLGYAYVTRQQVAAVYGSVDLDDQRLEQIKKHMRAEVEEYSEYVNGNVYGYKLFRKEKCNLGEWHYIEEDSTWGFIGDYKKSGMLDYLPDEVKPLLLGKEAA